MHLYYSVYLYALAAGNEELQRFSRLLLAMEVTSTKMYYHMGDDSIYDNIFATNKMVGNVGALDVTSSTWYA